MNKQLMELRKQFKGQVATVKASGFNNEPLPEGTYVARVTESKLKEKEREDVSVPVHHLTLKVEVGEHKGRNLWPFSPNLSTLDGLISSAGNVRAIKGEKSVPGKVLPNGEFQLAVDQYLEDFDSIAASLVGELVEVKVKNSKRTRDDGTPFQSVFINRGLGEDAAGALESQKQQSAPSRMTDAALPPSRKRKPVR